MAVVECQAEHEKQTVSGTHAVTTGFCSKCGAYVSRSQYGRDDECPECGEWLDWWGEK